MKNLKRAYSISECLAIKHKTLNFEGDFGRLLGTTDATGIWVVCGHSGNGKSSFVMQLCKELSRFGTVLFNSHEEEVSLTMQNTLIRNGMMEVDKKVKIVPGEDMESMVFRMLRKKGPDFCIVDYIQEARINKAKYEYVRDALKNKKLVIFVSRAEGKLPISDTARDIWYGADEKIWVEGFRAYSNGRFYSEDKSFYYTIWEEGANMHWGEQL